MKEIPKTKTLRRNLILETCGQNGIFIKNKEGKKMLILNHKNGCYIRFSSKEYHHSEERNDVVVDRDKKGRLIGIEFYEGL